MANNKDIYSTKFYQDRIELIRKDEEERQNFVRRPSTERYVADRTVKLLVTRNSLSATLKNARSKVSQNLDYGAPSEDGNIMAKPLDLDAYKTQRQIISDSLAKMSAIDKAVIALSEMGCPFYGDLVNELNQTQSKIRNVSTKIDKLKHSTMFEATETQSQIKELTKELAECEKVLQAKENTKTKMDAILLTIEDIC